MSTGCVPITVLQLFLYSFHTSLSLDNNLTSVYNLQIASLPFLLCFSSPMRHPTAPSVSLCISSFPSVDSIDFWHSWCFPRPHYWQPLCVPFQYRMPFFFVGTLHPHTTHTQKSLTVWVTCKFTNGINVWWAFLDTKCPNGGPKQQHVVWKHFCRQLKFQCRTVKTSFLKSLQQCTVEGGPGPNKYFETILRIRPAFNEKVVQK